MEGSDWKDTQLLGRMEVLENLDTQSRVLRGTVAPNGAAHTVSMPCHAVLAPAQAWLHVTSLRPVVVVTPQLQRQDDS